MNTSINSLLLLLICWFSYSCNTKDEPPKPAQEPTNSYGKLKITFKHVYQNEPFELNKKYPLITNDTITISEFKYVISNITLIDTTFGKWEEKNSYYIIDQTKPNIIIIDSIPMRKYFKLALDLGLSNKDLPKTSILTYKNSQEETESMLSDDKKSNLHLKMDGYFYTNLDSSGVFKIRNSTKSYSTNYLFGDLTPHRTTHNVPHTPVELIVKENETLEIEITGNIDWLFNSPIVIDFDDPNYRNNLNTVLFSNYNSGFFTYKQLNR